MTGEGANDERAPGDQPTLGEEVRAVATARIIQGAITVMVARGFDATVDDIAVAAGVSRRTVFRHFATHDELLATAIAEIRVRYDRLLPGPPRPGTDLESWLSETAVTLHDLNARLMGRVFWDMNVEGPGMSADERRRLRMGWSSQIARHAWHVADGTGNPPSWVVDAFALQLSGFATNCLAGYSAAKAGRVSARVLSAVLAAALAEEPSRPR